jgi:hypothetical protein
MRSKIMFGVVGIVVALAIVASAQAGGMNYATCWETWGGAKWNGYVQIQASYNDNGLHAKQGYHRFTREAGPPLDTGRLWTSQATSPSDSTIRWREDSVWDSPLWGDQYTTRYWYGFVWW